jgi:hypothetical protein
MGEMMDGSIPTMAHPHGQSLLFAGNNDDDDFKNTD